MKIRLLAFFAVLIPLLAARGDAPPLPPRMTLDVWKSALPFYFKYDGKESPAFISTWPRTEETVPAEGGKIHRITFSDPATKLKVIADVRTFDDFDAIDWVLRFSNAGSADTPIIEDIQALDWNPPELSRDPGVEIFYGCAGGESFRAAARGFGDPKFPVRISGDWGLSSHGSLPYFDYYDGFYDGQMHQKSGGGFIGAVGWTGGWDGSIGYDREAKKAMFKAGMKATHLRLHPGETIRSPRIVMLNWTGDYLDSHNLWRRFVLAHYCPRDEQGHPVSMPAAALVPAGKTAGAQIAAFHDNKIPLGLIWMTGAWAKLRGSWTPDPALFRAGLKPLVDAAHQARYPFCLPVEPETADPGSALLTAHPDWFLPRVATDQRPQAAAGPAILNMGNPDARKAITGVVSDLVAQSGADWLEHDFSLQPEQVWAAADAPDRVGISEIKYIEGLYDFWDELRARHPGLVIATAADDGGNRMDIEAASRCVFLWRNSPMEPMCEALETQELSRWVPLNNAEFGPMPASNPLFAFRSTYGPGLTLTQAIPFPYLRQVVDEYREVAPFFTGDFYPTTEYGREPDTWTVWRWHRPDLKAGVVIALRREESPFASVQPGLRGIDPGASYQVEVRHGLEKGQEQTMMGKDLAALQITVPETPGSALVFYRETHSSGKE